MGQKLGLLQAVQGFKVKVRKVVCATGKAEPLRFLDRVVLYQRHVLGQLH